MDATRQVKHILQTACAVRTVFIHELLSLSAVNVLSTAHYK
jgi:hypothetical protein